MGELNRLRIVPIEEGKEPVEEVLDYLKQLQMKGKQTLSDLSLRELLTFMAKTEGLELVERRKTLTTEQFSSNAERSNEAQRRKSKLQNEITRHFRHLGPFQRVRSYSLFSWLDVDHPEFEATVLLTNKGGVEHEVKVGPGSTYKLIR
ncbi:MAG: hypothetical protein FJ044_00430 [Candidatus Cloacimonetes bacterium]|nr:hypothetical protein [Candidatus Cloacimonadota bacterium]